MLLEESNKVDVLGQDDDARMPGSPEDLSV